MRSKVFGAILIAIGAILLLNPTPLHMKISFSAVIIGLFSIIVVYNDQETNQTAHSKTSKSAKKTKKKTKKKVQKTEKTGIKNIQLHISEKITLIIGIWILFLLIITGDADMETFFVAIFIGMLVVKELSDEFTTKYLKYDMNVFIFAFLMVFIAIMGKKIISIASI